MVTGLAGVVLAGGSGRRLGGYDKALLRVDGTRLVDLVVDELGGLADPIVLARGQLPPIVGLGLVQVPDALPDAGPLGGIVAGLEAVTGAEAAAVVAVDSPGVSAPVLAHLAAARGDADVAMAVVDGRAQPLHAVYAVDVAPHLRERLEAGERRLLSVLADLDVRRVAHAELVEAGLVVEFDQDIDRAEDRRRWGAD